MRNQVGASIAQVTPETWKAEFPMEHDRYYQIPLVANYWMDKTKVFRMAGTGAIGVFDQVVGLQVPGLNVSFREVFQILQDEECPLWIIGGAVRDLLAGGTVVNDLDCLLFCHPALLGIIANKHQWNHEVGGSYFKIGTKPTKSDGTQYLEGFDFEATFDSPAVPEFTVNFLFWSPESNFVIDPSGDGVQDVAVKVLRPPFPPTPHEGPEKSEWWQGLEQYWLRYGFAGPALARHVRYLKMRMQGFEPADQCFRLFMADVIEAMVSVEQDSKTLKFGRTWQLAQDGTANLLETKYGGAGVQAQQSAIQKLKDVYEQDMGYYFGQCQQQTATCGQEKLVCEYGGTAGDAKDVFDSGVKRTCQGEHKSEFSICDAILQA